MREKAEGDYEKLQISGAAGRVRGNPGPDGGVCNSRLKFCLG